MSSRKKVSAKKVGAPDETVSTIGNRRKLTETEKSAMEREKAARADIMEAKAGRMQGELMEKESIGTAIEVILRTLRDHILNVPNRIDAELAAATDRAACNRLLYSELEGALNEAADALHRA